MGRPSNVKRKEVWFTPAEWETIERRAKASFMKTGTYIKAIALRGEIHTIDIKALSGLESALRSIGNNINHIAKSNGIYNPADVERLLEHTENLDKKITTLKDNLEGCRQ